MMNPFATLMNQLVPDSAPTRRPNDDDQAALETGIVKLRRMGHSHDDIIERMHCTNEVVCEILKKHRLNSKEALYRIRLNLAREDGKRIDKLDAIRKSGKPGAWSTALLAMREAGDKRALREIIDSLKEE